MPYTSCPQREVLGAIAKGNTNKYTIDAKDLKFQVKKCTCCCLFDLACFFLPSHLSLTCIHVNYYVCIYTCMHVKYTHAFRNNFALISFCKDS